MSYSMWTPTSSKSHESFGVYWKCQRQLAGVDVERDRRVRVQVVARAELRVVDRIRVAGADDVELVAGSKEPVCQMPPPPVFHALWSSFQVSLPGSPGLGTV